VKLGVLVEIILDKAGEMGAEDASLVSRGAGTVISNRGIFAQKNTDADNLRRVRSTSAVCLMG